MSLSTRPDWSSGFSGYKAGPCQAARGCLGLGVVADVPTSGVFPERFEFPRESRSTA